MKKNTVSPALQRDPGHKPARVLLPLVLIAVAIIAPLSASGALSFLDSVSGPVAAKKGEESNEESIERRSERKSAEQANERRIERRHEDEARRRHYREHERNREHYERCRER